MSPEYADDDEDVADFEYTKKAAVGVSPSERSLRQLERTHEPRRETRDRVSGPRRDCMKDGHSVAIAEFPESPARDSPTRALPSDATSLASPGLAKERACAFWALPHNSPNKPSLGHRVNSTVQAPHDAQGSIYDRLYVKKSATTTSYV